MAVVLFQSGAFRVSVKHLWRKHQHGVWYYRRRYPNHVREALAQQGVQVPTFRVVSLKTKDPAIAAQKVAMLTRKDDWEWSSLAGDPEGTPPDPVDVHGLGGLGLPEAVRGSLLDPQSPDTVPRKPGCRARLSEIRDYYLEVKQVDRNKRYGVEAAFRMIFDPIGDLPLSEYRRADVSAAIDAALASGRKTGTVQRRLNTLRAAVAVFLLDKEIDSKNVFEKHKIKGKGEDVAERGSLDASQVARLRAFIRQHDRPTTNIMGLLLDTGARLSEVAGLMREDVKLDAPVPHVVLHENPVRRLKTKHSRRKVPLVGDALLTAQRAYSASRGGTYLFPRYMSDRGLKNESASAALAKVMKSLNCHTPHWLRHTMRTRLKNVNAQEHLINEIGGWARVSVGQTYGDQTALSLMREVLERSLKAVLE